MSLLVTSTSDPQKCVPSSAPPNIPIAQMPFHSTTKNVRSNLKKIQRLPHQAFVQSPSSIGRRHLRSGVSTMSSSSSKDGDTLPSSDSDVGTNSESYKRPQDSLRTPCDMFKHLKFTNSAMKALPFESRAPGTVGSRETPGAVWASVEPTPVTNPQTVSHCMAALKLLDIPEPTNADEFTDLRDNIAQYFSGNVTLPGMVPAAHCYAGTQFGNFAGQLGDGRATNLGEITNKRGQKWELQLKGAGLTPYSRTADGRAVFRSSIREYICSEHMHALGIATTRAASLVTSDTLVVRDPMYDGHTIEEQSTVVLRLAPSFLRFGSWEVFLGEDERTGRAGPSAGAEHFPLAKQMLDHVVSTHYPDIWAAHDNDTDRYIAFFQELVDRTAETCAKWQGVGFVHGVLNTDNMSILGLTIDYGPYGFMGYFDSDMVPNHSDTTGRYRYQNQPGICKWNLTRLAQALDTSGVICMSNLSPVIENYDAVLRRHYSATMLAKLGLIRSVEESDRELVSELFATMNDTGCDMTALFRELADVPVTEGTVNQPQLQRFIEDSILPLCCSSRLMAKRIRPDMPLATMQRLIDLGEEKPGILLSYTGRTVEYFKKLIESNNTANEMDTEDVSIRDQRVRDKWGVWLPQYIERLHREVEVEPATSVSAMNTARKAKMATTNPKFTFKNHLAQEAIEMAENGDYTEIDRLLTVMCDPFGLNPETEASFDTSKYAAPVPEKQCDLVLSCSS
ncbi:hypothetical protein SARC_10209 [Sphaeroforma arctica JP610]|uniref:Selenoprotein O n=1 Tax=Sphaeroforma arctica JP610 TaxID=667725 RepID=A0A0L0FKL9_9EUKA|nr:hypothetical protein SARC_10209 [Sphaeroforma arctica JP610]KNC77329.1 hypothetical protein SARC_10209 [Sphaeroforma arctica JP610]|eukprot:XP_014151231.1 hypothetical protein SARC_10209 [Sphaeroforma arctica JP610]